MLYTQLDTTARTTRRVSTFLLSSPHPPSSTWLAGGQNTRRTEDSWGAQCFWLLCFLMLWILPRY